MVNLQPTLLLRQSIQNTFTRYARHPLPAILPEPPPTWAEPFKLLAAEAQLPVSTPVDAYQQYLGFLQVLD